MLLSSILYELLTYIYKGHVFLNLHHNSFKTKGRLVRMVDEMAANLNDFFFFFFHLLAGGALARESKGSGDIRFSNEFRIF